ncbi:cytochrome P450 family protein [Ceratobasidium sp. AG-Ba]|nr:cytochrome P450 family protein [Ceratobasidium sp. AG-Ba]
MSVRISAVANNLVRLWTRKLELVGNKAFAADQDLKLATMVSMVMGDSPSAVDLAYNSLSIIPTSLDTNEGVANIPHSNFPPLQTAINQLTESIEQLRFLPLPVYITKIFIQDLSPSWRKSRNMVSKFIDYRIAEAQSRESDASKKKLGEELATDADCVVDMIAQREAREGEEKFDNEELRDELMTFVLAGQDTASIVMSWLVKYLPQDMELQRKLHDEVCLAFGPKEDHESQGFDIVADPGKTPILEAVVAETLRCARVAPMIARECE